MESGAPVEPGWAGGGGAPSTQPIDARAAAVAREVVERARELVLDEGIEFGSFALGLHFEDEALARAGWLERFRSSVKRLAGTALATEWTGRRVDLLRPEATFVYDPRAKKMEARLRSLFLYGRYRKLVRGLPQTRWHCRSCGGNGCAKCRGTGRVVPGSVEESIGEPVARAHRAWGEPLLHGMGREDADVTMLGSGRPFVLEVVSPRRRKVALEEVRVESGVELASPLRVVPGELVTRLKMLDPPKRYRAVCRAEAEIDPSRLPSLLALAGAEIQQRTPGRVQKSRADLVRPRRLLALEARVTGPRELELELTTEAGTYVKELVSGDEGRTSPSVASVLSVPIAVFELTVLEIRIEDEAVLGGESASPYAKPKP